MTGSTWNSVTRECCRCSRWLHVPRGTIPLERPNWRDLVNLIRWLRQKYQRPPEAAANDLRNGAVLRQRQSDRFAAKLKLARQVLTELFEQLIVERELVPPLIVSNRRNGCEVLGRHFLGPRPINVVVRWDPPDRGLHGARPTLAALHDPLQHSHVLTEPRPGELPVGVGAKPVDQENMRLVSEPPAHFEPVAKVITHVVADEWNHRHWVAPHHADLTGRGRGRFRPHRRTEVDTGIPIECSDGERHGA